MLVLSRFAVNRIACPHLPLSEFVRLVRGLGLGKIELRTDLPELRVFDGMPEAQVRQLLDEHAVQVISINVLLNFNLPDRLDQTERELAELVRTARAVRCPAVLLCPHNSPGDRRDAATRYRDSLAALNRFGPHLRDSGVTGYIEPLGFKVSSLDSLITAGRLIEESPHKVYRAVFDTFHHFLGPDETEALDGGFDFRHIGLVHISGVSAGIQPGDYLDAHRDLPGASDHLESREQLRLLLRHGYSGDVSFEPFSPEIQRLGTSELKAALAAAIEYLK